MEERFVYVMKVDGKVVWEGRNPQEKYFKIGNKRKDSGVLKWR